MSIVGKFDLEMTFEKVLLNKDRILVLPLVNSWKFYNDYVKKIELNNFTMEVIEYLLRDERTCAPTTQYTLEELDGPKSETRRYCTGCYRILSKGNILYFLYLWHMCHYFSIDLSGICMLSNFIVTHISFLSFKPSRCATIKDAL